MTPEEEAAVSRLLSDAAGPVTMPASVSARLDDVLAGLVAERTDTPVPQPLGEVIPIKHRRWPKVLMAAAAVTVLGYAGSSLLQQGSGQDDAATSADSGAAVDRSGVPEAALGETEQDSAVRGAAPQPPDGVPLAPQANLLADLARDTYRLNASAKKNLPTVCPTPSSPGALAYQRTLDKQEVVVVLNRIGGNASRADIYACGQTVIPVASTLLLDAR